MTAVVSQRRASATKPNTQNQVYEIRRRKRFWAVINSAGELVCMTVYKRGAKEVVRLLTRLDC